MLFQEFSFKSACSECLSSKLDEQHLPKSPTSAVAEKLGRDDGNAHDRVNSVWLNVGFEEEIDKIVTVRAQVDNKMTSS